MTFPNCVFFNFFFKNIYTVVKSQMNMKFNCLIYHLSSQINKQIDRVEICQIAFFIYV